jgi:hypothetical protein
MHRLWRIRRLVKINFQQVRIFLPFASPPFPSLFFVKVFRFFSLRPASRHVHTYLWDIIFHDIYILMDRIISGWMRGLGRRKKQRHNFERHSAVASPFLLRFLWSYTAASNKITVAAGDGIGPEITNSTLAILEAAQAGLKYDFIEVGEKVYLSGETSGISPVRLL